MAEGVKLAASIATAEPTEYPPPSQIPSQLPDGPSPESDDVTNTHAKHLKIVVTPFIYRGLHPLTTADVEQATSAFLAKHEEFDVLNHKDFEEVLGFAEVERFVHCKTETPCLAELASELGFDKLVTGVVNPSQAGYQLDLMLIDTHKGLLEKQESEEVFGGKERMIEVADILATRLSLHLFTAMGLLPLPSLTSESSPLAEPHFLESNYRKWKWGGMALAAGTLLLAIGAGTMSQTWEGLHSSMLNDLRQDGTIVANPDGYQFRDATAKREYRDQLNELKGKSERDARIANVGFIVCGVILGISAWMFYADSEGEMK